MRLHLGDTDPDVVAALRVAFAASLDVTVEEADILSVARGTIVSPANSYGFMDGGVDRAYLAYFGPGLQVAVQDAIARRVEGHLPVGAAIVVATRHARIPWLSVAPTMLMPEVIPAANIARAMRAVLRAASAAPVVGVEVFCPGLGSGVGRVAPDCAAREMARAFSEWRESTRRTE